MPIQSFSSAFHVLSFCFPTERQPMQHSYQISSLPATNNIKPDSNPQHNIFMVGLLRSFPCFPSEQNGPHVCDQTGEISGRMSEVEDPPWTPPPPSPVLYTHQCHSQLLTTAPLHPSLKFQVKSPTKKVDGKGRDGRRKGGWGRRETRKKAKNR